MRRKCLALTISFILTLTILHSMEIPLSKDPFVSLEEKTCVFTGKVMKLETIPSGGYRMEVKLLSRDGKNFEKGERKRIQLSYYGEWEEPWDLVYRTILFRGMLEEPAGQRNPGCFDYGLYLKSCGIFKTVTVDSFQITDEKKNFSERFVTFLIKEKFQYTASLAQTGKGLITGVLFGDTGAMEEAVYETFRDNGTAHILAVSGLHIGILYGIYKKIVGKRKNYFGISLLGLMILSYGTVSLWSPSVLRASMMIGCSVAAKTLDLRYDAATALSAVALILILQNPYVIFGAGFQMSFLAILSIISLKPAIPHKIPDGLALTLAVNGGLVFYQMYQFNYISFVSVFVNIPIIFLTGILVPVALVSFFFFILIGDSGWIGYITDSLAFFLIQINQWSSLDGYGAADVISPPFWFVIAFYFLLFFWFSEYRLILSLRKQTKIIKIWIAGIMICAVLLGGLYKTPLSEAELVFVDVGQGDCLHIRDGEKNVLIDGGGNVNYNVGKNTLKPYLLKNGVRQIDIAVATHLHTDHFRGLQELEKEYPVKHVLTGLVKGDRIRLSDRVWIETLWPLSIDEEKGQEENHQCSVFMIYYNGWKILVTGDLDQEGEEQMLKVYAGTETLKADILKIGHHGSKSSTCDAFLEEVSPAVAVIQVGESNLYGHPHRKVVEKCQENGIMVVRTDENGAIGFSLEKGKIKIDRMIKP